MKKQPEKKIKKEESWGSFFRTLMFAVIAASIVRSFFYEPFHIPSSSMKPGLLVGDYIFVSKMSYGYSKYSFPFSLNLFSGRVLKEGPKRGDVAVFRLPTHPSINYIKRIIGLPGDEIQMIGGQLQINSKPVPKKYSGIFKENNSELAIFNESLPEGKNIVVLDQYDDAPQDNTPIYKVPEGHYFAMGDNRDNSQDSRFQTQVGFIPAENLVGRAEIIFFSTENPVWKLWKLHNSIRFDRIFSKIK